MGQDLARWIATAAMALAAINTLWMWVRSGRLPTEAAIEKLDGRLDEHARQIQAIEGEMRHMPTKDDLQKVTLGLAQMLGRMDVIQTELASTSRSLRRMEDHMREAKQ